MDNDTIVALSQKIGLSRQWTSHCLSLGMPRQPADARKWLDDRRSKSDERAARHTFDGQGGPLTDLDRTLIASLAGGDQARKALDYASSLIRGSGYSESEALCVANSVYGTTFPCCDLRLVPEDEVAAKRVTEALHDTGARVVDMVPGSVPRSQWDCLEISKQSATEARWYRDAAERRGRFQAELMNKLDARPHKRGESWADSYASAVSEFDAKLVQELADLRAKA